MKRPPSNGQHFWMGRFRSVGQACGWPTDGLDGRNRIKLVHDLLARAVLDHFRSRMAQIQGRAEQLDCGPQAQGRLGLHERAELGRRRFHRTGAQAHRHPPVRAEHVDGHRKGRDLAVHGGLLDQERPAAARLLHLAIRQLGDFQLGGDWRRDASQFTRLFERHQEIAKGVKCHIGRQISKIPPRRTPLFGNPAFAVRSRESPEEKCFFPGAKSVLGYTAQAN